MFSSNQILDVLCDDKSLPRAIRFAVSLYGDEIFTRHDGRVRMAFAEPVPGVYLIGRGSMEPYQTGPNKGWSSKLGKGWTDYPFDYDPSLIAGIVAQWASKQPVQMPHIDGSVEKGIRLMSVDTAYEHEMLPKPWHLPDIDMDRAVLAFTAHPLEYHK